VKASPGPAEGRSERLAFLGGPPMRNGPRPKWPLPAPATRSLLEEVLDSGRWSVGSVYLGARSMGRRFAHAYADYMGIPYCIPTSSGTASLTVALEALGIGPGDEVLVPGLTWVACASAIANVNATPVLVDIDPDTLCMSPEAAEAAITPRTAAIMIVHLYSAIADLGRLIGIANRHGLALVEDCAQAHGAEWNDRRVGTLGEVGAFSMQHGKVLTSGEGGAVITSDPELAERMQQLTADGRLYGKREPAVGEPELLEAGTTPGNNWCLSEFQSAVLLGQLEQLDALNERRRQAAATLTAALTSDGWVPQVSSPGTTARTFYKYAVAFNPEDLCGLAAITVADALSAELGFKVFTSYAPLNSNKLFAPGLRRRWHTSKVRIAALDPRQYELPNCTRAHAAVVTLHHSALLGEHQDIEDIANCFRKVRRLAHQLG
jgi:dTDP-4-amino-4,6-dideoxygalactose transaminase